MMKLALLLIVYATYVSGQTANYCATTLCSGKVHIACGNTGSFASTCSADRAIIPISPYMAVIVQKHNTYRNTIAGGNLPGFLAASRMATMVWDDELASLAELNVKQCEIKHDACRNTDRFKFSGQNLAWRWGSPAPSASDAIVKGIDSWFNEYKDASMVYINKYQSSPKTIGHFTAMVNDRNTRIGCALLKQSDGTAFEFFFACNYAQTNVLNYAIYKSGTAASSCTTGNNNQYPALCSATEPINPNQL